MMRLASVPAFQFSTTSGDEIDGPGVAERVYRCKTPPQIQYTPMIEFIPLYGHYTPPDETFVTLRPMNL